MLTVDDYGAIRRAYRDRKSIREIAREFGHSRKTIRHVLNHGEPNPGPLTRNRPAPVVGPFVAIIDQILVDDEEAPPKQRHTGPFYDLAIDLPMSDRWWFQTED